MRRVSRSWLEESHLSIRRKQQNSRISNSRTAEGTDEL
jgi:hypothetical protein